MCGGDRAQRSTGESLELETPRQTLQQVQECLLERLLWRGVRQQDWESLFLLSLTTFDGSFKDFNNRFGRLVGMVPLEDSTDIMIGVLAWEAGSLPLHRFLCCILELAESNYSVWSWEDMGHHRFTGGDLLWSWTCFPEKYGLFNGMSYYWVSQSTPHDQGCILVPHEYQDLVKCRAFTISVCFAFL